MSFNLPNPSLLGLLLVVSTHSGPHIVYHYPPSLSDNNFLSESDDDFDDEDYDPDDNTDGDLPPTLWNRNHSDFYLGAKDDLLTFLDSQNDYLSRQQDATSGSGQKPNHGLQKVTSASSRSSIGQYNAAPTQILGFEPEHLSEILCPPRELCNRKFEIKVENTVFVGLPIRINSSGSWRKSKTKAASSNGLKAKSQDKTGENPKAPDLSTTADPPKASSSDMSMFHLVFVMQPPQIESSYRVEEMFYVTSKLSLMLRYEQAKHDYVWNQIRLISKAKEEWRTTALLQQQSLMSAHVLSKSSLCQLMKECHDSISSSKIANLTINNKLRSLQIPVKMEFTSLPDQTVPYIPGSFLSSTVSSLGSTGLALVGETDRYRSSSLMQLVLGGNLSDLNDGANADDNEDLDNENKLASDDIMYLSLLLLDDPETIIKEIKAEGHATLANFIRHIRPVDSLFKTVTRLRNQLDHNILRISEVRSFALHLIYWRKARAIPPLNVRSVYIVSPLAPITENLLTDIPKFKASYSTVPSLPQFLKLLSIRSKSHRQFGSIIPSKDHKEIYLSALAWLIRHGYVTQLHTFIWLKVPRKVRMRVEEDMEVELEKTSKKSQEKLAPVAPSTENKVNSKVVDNSLKIVSDLQLPSDEEINQIHKKLEMANLNPFMVLEDEGDTILVDPGRASGVERRWLNRLIRDECKLSSELTATFFKLLKYMNGKTSLELLLAKEEVSRTELRKLLIAIEDHVISVLHW